MPDCGAPPLYGWPRYLSRDDAARYVGVSATTFDYEVDQGWWPPARRRGRGGTRLTWDRVLLDRFADQEHVLLQESPALADAPPDQPVTPDASTPASAAEAAALRGIVHAKIGDRPKHRHAKAA